MTKRILTTLSRPLEMLQRSKYRWIIMLFLFVLSLLFISQSIQIQHWWYIPGVGRSECENWEIEGCETVWSNSMLGGSCDCNWRVSSTSIRNTEKTVYLPIDSKLEWSSIFWRSVCTKCSNKQPRNTTHRQKVQTNVKTNGARCTPRGWFIAIC